MQSLKDELKYQVFYGKLITYVIAYFRMNNMIGKLIINGNFQKILVFLFPLALYFNTLNNSFVLDDNIVIKKNEYVTRGVSGIPDILKYDTFKGFLKSENSATAVTGGRYRPLTLIFFAFVYEFVGENAFIFHLLNILFFSLLCLSIYLLLARLLKSKFPDYANPISFLATLLFATHPIHTEVVANVKGLDEIFSLWFSVLAFLCILKSIDDNKKIWLWTSLPLFALALFSKENAIHYVLLIPIGLIMFRNLKLLDTIKNIVPILIASILYISARVAVLGFSLFDAPTRDLMTNPFLKMRGNSLVEATSAEKLGMIFYTLIKYIGLLIFPHPLTHDYFPKQIPLVSLASGIPLLSLLFYSLIIFFTIRYFKSKTLISFSLLAYLIPLILISNLVINIGTPMGERFIFASSLGFCILIGYGLFYLFQKNKWAGFTTLFLIIGLYSVKTISRNLVWKDDYKLFSTDVEVSKNSAKAHSSLAYNRIEKFKVTKDSLEGRKILDEAVIHLDKTIQLYPRNINAIHLLGNSYYMRKEYLKAAETYEKYLDLVPTGKDVIKNLQASYREQGRMMALKQIDLDKSIDYLIKAMKINPNDARLLESLGIAYGVKENFPESIKYFNKALEMNPPNAGMMLANLANTYFKMGDKNTATEFMKKAYRADPGLGYKLSTASKGYF
ncbi:MAG: glycosyltransferase family 39 protein [Saprospiraceae bacterium]|nr:glycosyltransferase family 39 protein [Candidatus Vicinibacter affinis]